MERALLTDLKGRVVNVNYAKGYAFVRVDGAAGRDYFLHFRNAPGIKLNRDVWLRFDVRENPINNKMEAYNVSQLSFEDSESDRAWASNQPGPVKMGDPIAPTE
jgi:cold shock CspA family protein